MPTYADLQGDIADDIADSVGEYTAQIKKAILGAIRYYSNQVYYFNELQSITFPTVNGRQWYDAADNANIPTLVHITEAYSEDSQGQRATLFRDTPENIEILSDNSGSNGEPYAWTYFGQRIRLYPTPNAQVFTIRLQVTPYRLDTLEDDTDTNAWLNEAYDLIKARAKYILAKNTLLDVAVATEALNDAADQDNRLKAETSSRNGRGYITATCF